MKNIQSPYFFLLAFIILWTIVASLFSYILPLDVLENLSWGQLWQWGYYKHPPLQAWQQEIMVLIFGRRDWPAFLLSFLNIAIALYFLYKIARQIELPLWLAQLMPALGAFIYYYNIRGVEFNANVATLSLSLAYISCFMAAANHRKLIYWLALGVIAALGMLAKYSFGILLFSSLPAILYIRSYRSLLWHKGPYLSVLVMGLILWPHIHWLYEVDFLPFGYIKNSIEDSQTLVSYLMAPFIFVILQISVLLPSFFALWLLAKPRALQKVTDKQKLAFLLAVIPLFIFMILGWFFPAGVRTFWGYTLPMGLLLGVMFIAWQPRENFEKKANIFKVIAILLPGLIFIGIWALSPYVRDTGKKVDAKGAVLAQMAQDYWKKHTGEEKLPEWIVANEHWGGEVISWYSSHRPKLIYVTGAPSHDKLSPWIGKLVDPYDKEFKALWVSPVTWGLNPPKGFCIYQAQRVILPWRHKGYTEKKPYDFGIYKLCEKK